MKSFISLGMVVLAAMLCVATASAQSFTLNASALSQLYEVYENPAGSTALAYVGVGTYNDGNSIAGQVGYRGPISSGTSAGFAQIQVGANFWGTDFDGGTGHAKVDQVLGAALGGGSTWDLSGFGDYQLSLFNDNDDWWMVNLYLNVGWTDAPYSETDVYAQNTWTWLGPGQSATLKLDFANAEIWSGGYQGWGAISNYGTLTHMSNIGINIGSNMTGGLWDPSNPGLGYFPSNGDVFHTSASPIPEPTTLVLLGALLAGGGALSLRRRLRQK